MRGFLLGSFVLLSTAITHAKITRITVLQTGDIHSHYTNRDVRDHLGGIARMKTVIDDVRSRNTNSLLLDSGDWTEGSMFFTIGAGAASHRVMEYLGYDAIVLGNHEWLIGPKEMYQAFDEAQFKIPVLSANINMKRLPKEEDLRKYIVPYIIKNVGGKKVGIFGLSTFELMYDYFFEPVKISEPWTRGHEVAKKLKKDLGCDVVIAVTHIGLKFDEMLAWAAPDVDLIVGGHTHVLTKKPKVVNGTPIVHVEKWGRYLGEYELTIDNNNKVELTDHKIHEIHPGIKEDLGLKLMIEGFEDEIVNYYGNVFDDNIIHSEVDMEVQTGLFDDALGNWAVDAIREATDAPLGLDVGMYASRELFRGWSSSFDIFNIFPHVFSRRHGDAWTVQTVEVRGWTIQLLLNVLAKAKFGVKLSNASMVIDTKAKYFPVKQLRVDGGKVKWWKKYKIAGTRGVIETFKMLKKYGVNLRARNVKDTGVIAWHAIRDKLASLSPITRQTARWEGRVRTKQPDIHIPIEQVVGVQKDGYNTIKFQVINAGLETAEVPKISIKIDATPNVTIDDHWQWAEVEINRTELEPGEIYAAELDWAPDFPQNANFKVIIESSFVPGEVEKKNNVVETYVPFQWVR